MLLARPQIISAWGRADSAFQRVGAAYGALGGLGDRIDGGAGGLPQGVRDPGWRGLKRIEYDQKRDFVGWGGDGDEDEFKTVAVLSAGAKDWRFVPAASAL